MLCKTKKENCCLWNVRIVCNFAEQFECARSSTG